MTALGGDLAAAFEGYEQALMDGDLAAQQQSFWSDPSVVRVDGDGPLVGPAALAEFRARRPTPGPRRLRDLHIVRSEEHTSELQSHLNLVCRLLLEKKNNVITHSSPPVCFKSSASRNPHDSSRSRHD